MGLAILGLEIGIFCDFRYNALLLSMILGLNLLGPPSPPPQVADLEAGVRLAGELGPTPATGGPSGAAAAVGLGLGHFVALNHRSSTVYQIHYENRCLCS